MTEFIKPMDYTPEIRKCLTKLEARLFNTLIDYKSDDFLVLKSEDSIFVLANPVLGKEAIYDDFGKVVEYIPMRNITLVYYDHHCETEVHGHNFLLPISLPRLRVLRPDLCLKIENGMVTDCGIIELETVATKDWERQARNLILACMETMGEYPTIGPR